VSMVLRSKIMLVAAVMMKNNDDDDDKDGDGVMMSMTMIALGLGIELTRPSSAALLTCSTCPPAPTFFNLILTFPTPL
jgi:hypothetical protein